VHGESVWRYAAEHTFVIVTKVQFSPAGSCLEHPQVIWIRHRNSSRARPARVHQAAILAFNEDPEAAFSPSGEPPLT
jgi:hypothetical protein